MDSIDISTSPGPNDWEEEEREIYGEETTQEGEGEEVEEEEEVRIKTRPEQNDPVLSSHVVAVLNELGHYNRMTNTYQLNEAECQACLRDLIRFLRNDGQAFFVRRQMGMSNIVDNDLIPIIEQHTVDINTGAISEEGKSLMDKVIRLLVDLTNPTMLHYRDQQAPKTDKDEIPIFLQLQNILYKYKVSFALKKRFWIVLAKHISRILAIDEVERQLEDTMMFERIVILIRNVLHIPIMEDQSEKVSLENNVQDRIIEHLHESGILEILQYMITSNEFNEYCFHIIEIIFLMFREQSAEYIARSVDGDPLASTNLLPEDRKALLQSAGRSQYEIDLEKEELAEAFLRDQLSQIVVNPPRHGSGKYSRPVYVVKNLKSISDRDMIVYKPTFNPEVDIDLNREKKAKGKARNRRPMQQNIDNSDARGVQRIHRSSRKIRLILNEFATNFLADCYNSFMRIILGNLTRGASQDHDETYYLWAVQFFMEFNRFRAKATEEERYQSVKETFTVGTFHFIQTKMDDYVEHLGQKQFKVELGDWAKRLHCALRAYREMLSTLNHVDGFSLPDAKKLSHKIKNDLFTEQEYREMLWRLLKAYDELKMSKAYLRDLIETNHLFLKMLDYHIKISIDFKVKVKQRKRTKRKAEKKAQKEANEEVPIDPEEVWNDINQTLLETLNADRNDEANLVENSEELRQLFDPLSERSLDEQKLYLMRKINSLLLHKDVPKAVSLYREARIAMLGLDEENTFGDMDIASDDELVALKEILFTEFPKEASGRDDEPSEDESEEEEDQSEQTKEVSLSAEDTLRKYANPDVLRGFRLMLKNFQHNKPETNHAIVRMLYRIAVELKMSPLFFNLGFLTLFERILSDPALRLSEKASGLEGRYIKSIKELGEFAQWVTRQFFKLLKKNPRIAGEICFAANSRDAYAMEFGYDETLMKEQLKARNKKSLWSEEQELELEILYKEYKTKIDNGEVSLKGEDGKKRDIVDFIQADLIDQTKSRRQIITQLRKMGLLEGKIRAKKATTDVVVQYSSGEEDNVDPADENREEEEKEAEFTGGESEEDEVVPDENSSPNKVVEKKERKKKKKDFGSILRQMVKEKSKDEREMERIAESEFENTFRPNNSLQKTLLESDGEEDPDSEVKRKSKDVVDEFKTHSPQTESSEGTLSIRPKKRLRIEDDFDEQDETVDETQGDAHVEGRPAKRVKKRVLLEDDDDEEEMPQTDLFFDEKPTNETSALSLDDDDDEDRSTTVVRRKAMILDDDDE